jgi:hypothetical protein
MRRFLTAAALGSIAATNGRTSADLITYTETVVASGSLGGVQFTGALVTIVATADTAGVVRLQQFPAILAVDNASATILVAGLGEATFTTPTVTYVNTIDRGLGNNARSGIEAGTIAQPMTPYPSAGTRVMVRAGQLECHPRQASDSEVIRAAAASNSDQRTWAVVLRL